MPILELTKTHRGVESVCSCKNREEYIKGCYRHNCKNGRQIFDCTTARKMLNDFLDITEEEALSELVEDPEADCAWIVKLAEENGWDTPLYRADYEYGEGVYSTNEISEFDASVAYAGHDVQYCLIFESAEEFRERYPSADDCPSKLWTKAALLGWVEEDEGEEDD